jgi:hypothetical protein
MTAGLVRFTLVLAAVGLLSAPASRLSAEEAASPALAKAVTATTVTLQDGLKASVREGNPISAKFEVEHDALQLSVYTLKGGDFMEVVVDPKTGTVAKAEKITDAGDLKEAAAQKSAMAKATTALLAAADAAAQANPGSRAVSVYPQLQNGSPIAEVTLLQGSVFKKVTGKLD